MVDLGADFRRAIQGWAFADADGLQARLSLIVKIEASRTLTDHEDRIKGSLIRTRDRLIRKSSK